MSSRHYYGTNRYVCDVIKELRACHETRNYAILLSLLEEMQTLVNRMEAGLEDKSDLRQMSKDRTELKKEIRELEAKVKELKSKCPEDIEKK